MLRIKLSTDAVFKISHPGNRHIKEELACTLGVHISSINRLIAGNAVNGRLTTEASLKILERELQMERNDILQTGD